MDEPSIVAVGIATVVGPIVTWLLARRRNNVDTAGKIVELWQGWSDEQDKRIRALTDRVTTLETDLGVARTENGRLRDENTRQRRALRSIVQWAKALQTELTRLGGSSPPFPDAVVEAIAAELP